MESFIQYLTQYGYWFVFIGSCIEGESVVLLAGALAAKEIFSLPKIILIAFLGTLIIDQVSFHIGRHYGRKAIEKWSFIHDRSKRVFHLLHRFDGYFIMMFRFVYGIRIVSPFIIGAANIPTKRFTMINFPAAIIWSVTIAGIGYILGETIEALWDNFEVWRKYLFAAPFILAFLIWGGIKLHRLYVSFFK